MLSALSCRTTRMLIALNPLFKAMALLLASWLRRLTLTSTLFRSAAAMFRLLFSKLLVRLVSRLNVLLTLLIWVTAMLSRPYRTVAARLSVKLPTSAVTCSCKIAKIRQNFATGSVTSVKLLHRDSRKPLSKHSKTNATSSVSDRTTLSVLSTL